MNQCLKTDATPHKWDGEIERPFVVDAEETVSPGKSVSSSESPAMSSSTVTLDLEKTVDMNTAAFLAVHSKNTRLRDALLKDLDVANEKRDALITLTRLFDEDNTFLCAISETVREKLDALDQDVIGLESRISDVERRLCVFADVLYVLHEHIGYETTDDDDDDTWMTDDDEETIS